MSTIDGKTITQTITLGSINSYPTYTSPLTITATGTLGAGIEGETGTIINYGRILVDPNFGNAIDLNGDAFITNAQTGVIQSEVGVAVEIVGVATVINAGSILAYVLGVQSFAAGSTVINDQTGSIEAVEEGVDQYGGIVLNSGTILTTATSSLSLYFFASKTPTNIVTNNQAGLIQSPDNGVQVAGPLVTIVNSGTIVGGVNAVVVGSGYYQQTTAATITNAGLISGSVGVSIAQTNTAGVTMVNYGTIIGTSGTAISLGTVGSDMVVIGSATSSLQGVIADVQPGDRFDLPFLSFSTSGTTTVVSNGTVSQTLEVVENGGTFAVALDPNQNFSSDAFQLSSDSGGGTLITEQPVCFCRGTRILTDRGEMPVEALQVGDRVVTLSGAFKPIRWTGFGRDLVTRRNSLARPIIVRAGALADNMPRRDLYLTHGHSLYFDGVLIPVEHLVNHRSIRWDDSARVVEYYHIELDDHDVLLAEGAPAESYYDAGNRALFHNARPGSTPGAAKPSFAPVLHEGEIVGRVWAALDERAGERAAGDTTDDPDLHLVVDSARLDPASMAEGVYIFALGAPPAGPLRLASRSAVPSLLGRSRHEHRRLGVAIRQLVLSGPGMMTVFDHDAPLFREGGCHAAEAGFCWTDGRLLLPAPLFAHLSGPFRLFVHTARLGMRYPLSLPAALAA